ncbi:hypothetical protein COU15_03200 [Candidatus Kaiserbacteria bacterium CG10_big_fil_rev_8_21_14_0_10_45_20]|uniref:Uncharacterized protein n=1 Tax=Candidatus Kaiserbacteria bacterium CG10_big_fil_rev_8_21_14_0_10_45_20 TaxID=1974607 RepID=A0A2H0UEY8_9BACT|nr:MAG: hypothetical protein COU15_03200 [Candidatus Kaiserbacteria bacterium CG10_big_fil_rev_8_21_14_0_10_45_20]
MGTMFDGHEGGGLYRRERNPRFSEDSVEDFDKFQKRLDRAFKAFKDAREFLTLLFTGKR